MSAREIAGNVAAFAVGALAIGGFSAAVVDHYVNAPAPTPTASSAPVTVRSETPLPGCEEEDSNGCVWAADWMGNGEGKSFYADDNGNVTYIDAGQWAYRQADGTITVRNAPADAEYLP